MLCAQFGIRPNCSQKREKNSRDIIHRDYKIFYDEELRQLVERKCWRELDAFGYSFDGHDERVIINPNSKSR